MYVEVFGGAEPGGQRGVLPAAVPGAAVGGAGRAGRAAAEGAGRAGPAAADVAGGLASGRRGMRVRPGRRIRPVPADDQPPPEGPARQRPAGPGEARRVGLLPGPDPGAGQPRRAARLPAGLTGEPPCPPAARGHDRSPALPSPAFIGYRRLTMNESAHSLDRATPAAY